MKNPVHTRGDSPSPGDSSLHGDSPRASHSAGRRTVLIAMPAILSLHQGVAAQVARTSAVLVKSETETLLCAGNPGLGGNEKGWFVEPDTQINVAEFTHPTYCKAETVEDRTSYSSVSRSEMCTNGGVYYLPQNGMNCNAQGGGSYTATPNVNQGAFVSALALSSFAGRVIRTEV